MAKGRMINNKIVFDKKIHNLSNDTSRLAFTWAITFADVEGRIYGDPAILRSMLFPRRQDISLEEMRDYITEWQEENLIIWYEVEGDAWIQFIRFEENQIGMRKDREAPSQIPAPLFRTNSGETPDEIPVKLKEVKFNGIEDKFNETDEEWKPYRARLPQSKSVIHKDSERLDKFMIDSRPVKRDILRPYVEEKDKR